MTSREYFGKRAIWLLIILINFLNRSHRVSCASDLLYNTTSGIYMARLVKVDVFDSSARFVHKITSVPYAEKPERFKKPVMRSYRSGKVHPIQPLVMCYQSVNLTSYGLFNIQETVPMSEDCLVVNLYIPVPSALENSQDYNDMSVVVHIHGGSNMVGGAPLFDGSILAAYGRVIVAVINYRLSIMGFLTDMTEKYPGNYALRDQLLAIKWIKNNCKVLKCNPESITLWGHSAGAGDVNWLAISPLSNKLFQRVIIQSGSSFSYWGYDRMPSERYKSLKKYFNCSQISKIELPESHTDENHAMTQLIEKCLIHLPLDHLFGFKFALIDAPGPIYDGYLGEEHSLINARSPQEMLKKKDILKNIDVLTGINRVEGFSFEGYFSSSIKFWLALNLTNDISLSLERFSLLSRDRCLQNLLIDNRHNFDKYYDRKIMSYLKNPSDINHTEVRRFKTIFVNSDSIFDSGFIEFLQHAYENKLESITESHINNEENEEKNVGKLFAYEYLHENYGSQSNLEAFKKFLKPNYTLSTHFDGIDAIFGKKASYF
jgi:acetyl esterase/lipase